MSKILSAITIGGILIIGASVVYNVSHSVAVSSDSVPVSPTKAVITSVQVLQATYSNAFGFQPTRLIAKAGIPIRMEVGSSDDGQGCMGSISLPQLSNDYYGFEKGKTVVFNVTPPGPGEYAITCAMGIPHGSLTF